MTTPSAALNSCCCGLYSREVKAMIGESDVDSDATTVLQQQTAGKNDKTAICIDFTLLFLLISLSVFPQMLARESFGAGRKMKLLDCIE